MRRRSKAGSEPVKRRGHHVSGQKPGKALNRRASTADLQQQLDRRTHERDEALEQQAATAEVLKVISHSAFDLQTVLDALTESAAALCQADMAGMARPRETAYHWVTTYGFSADFLEHVMNVPLSPGRGSVVGRALLERRAIQIADVLADPEYTYIAVQKRGGFRSVLGVPLLREENPIGVFFLARKSPLAFTDKQIELVSTFADQAVIAIENTRLLSELRQRTDDLTESLEQQTATSEVLRVISSSPSELQPVFHAILENAVQICQARFGILTLFDGNQIRHVASYNVPTAFKELRQRDPVVPIEGTVVGRVVKAKDVINLADVAAEEGHADSSLVKVAGARSAVGVPMLKEDELIGAIVIYRNEVRPFSDKQVRLLKDFAAQAVIAIENTRLLNELRQRTDDLTESLEQQTATSEVLKVISSSPGALEPVFEVMLENAVRICDAKFGNLWLREGDSVRIGAAYGAPPAYSEFLHREQVFCPESESGLARLLKTNELFHVPDIAAVPSHGDKIREATIRLAGARTLVVVPMAKDKEVVGAIAIYRQEVRPFTNKQIELVQNFAAQAVIAIENARLLSELRHRTDDLTETLEQQMATSEVLEAISSSPGNVKPVFQAMLDKATRLCEAKFGHLYLWDGATFNLVAKLNTPPALADIRQKVPIRPGFDEPLGRMLATKSVIHIADAAAEQSYIERSHPAIITAVELGGIRTLAAVPMLKDNELIGALTIYRQEVRPFSEKQIELVKNFAAQAVIAIENARLLNELRTRTNELAQSVGELRALGEVTQAVNSTVDLETVLTTIVAKATQLSNTEAGAIYVFDDANQEFRLRATYGLDDIIVAELRNRRIRLGETPISEAAERRMPIQIPDIQTDASGTFDIIVRAGFRALLFVPLLGTDRIVGALVVRRRQPGEFPKSTIELLQTFAAQSVLAIQNARLFEGVEARTRELARSLQDLRNTQDRLVQTEKLASLGQLTAGIAHEIKNPLNFVNNFSGVSVELIDELQETLRHIKVDDKILAEISELTSTLRGNLDKVVQHGKRADSIVKNMLQHSRQGSAEHRLVDINALVEESLNLAWHGARAEEQGFNITLERSLDPAAGEADVFPQDITRVLLNLISNGFYAATRRKAQADGGDYEPTLAASTKDLGDRVEITIRDNGTGIPPEVRDKMFDPFYTTKPAGEGTGLGLSISHDIIVKRHGGSVEVDTQPGEFTEIKITLPRLAVFPSEPAAHA